MRVDTLAFGVSSELKSVLLRMTQIETELRCFYLQDCLAGTRRYSYQQLFNIRPAISRACAFSKVGSAGAAEIVVEA